MGVARPATSWYGDLYRWLMEAYIKYAPKNDFWVIIVSHNNIEYIISSHKNYSDCKKELKMQKHKYTDFDYFNTYIYECGFPRKELGVCIDRWSYFF